MNDAPIVTSSPRGPVITQSADREQVALPQQEAAGAPMQRPRVQTFEAPAAPINPLLQKIQIPGRTFKLPSGGMMYQNGELASTCKNGEVHVKPLSAIAEIKMKNPDMLFSGQAIEEVFRECVPEVLNPLELFGRDIDALMCFVRVVTYGSAYDVDANHGCEGGDTHTYSIDLENVINGIKELDPAAISSNYSVTLPNGQVVELEPIRYKHVIDLLQANEIESPSAEEVQTQLMKSLLRMINNVDGVTDKAMIEEWARSVSTTYISKIADTMDKSNNWGPSFEQKVLCPNCGQPFMLELPVNPLYFFTE